MVASEAAGIETTMATNSKSCAYTATEREKIRSKLRKTLGPEFISQRQGPGGRKLAYITGDKCINIANYVFGFDGWSSVIRNIQTDFVEESSGKVSIGLSVVLRVVLKDGTFHEDIGYGEAENVKGKGPAFAKAKKQGQTDALKRCLRNFGEIFNCLSDDNYVKKVLRLKTKDAPLDEVNLLRNLDNEAESTVLPPSASVRYPPSDPIKEEVPQNLSMGADDEYGGDEFDDLEFLVEDQDLEGFLEDDSLQAMICNDGLGAQMKPKAEKEKVVMGGSNIASSKQGSLSAEQYSGNISNDVIGPTTRQLRPSPQATLLQANAETTSLAPSVRSNQGAGPQASKPSQIQKAWDRDVNNRQEQAPSRTMSNVPNMSNPPPTFYSAKAELSDTTRIEKPLFNPHFQSPSIPRSAGVDHTKSTPIPRGKYSAQLDTSPPNIGAVSRPNFNGPGNLGLRPVGIPSQMSPGNRGYKPPMKSGTAPQGNSGYLPQKRAFEGANTGNTAQRNVLSEATKTQVNVKEGSTPQHQYYDPALKDHDINKKQRI